MTSTLLEVQFPHKMNLVRRTTTAAMVSSSDAEVIAQQPTTSSAAAARKETFTKSRSESFGHESSERVVEEKRKRANGQEGYTVHKYIVGRMLGKGGFAKVYLCTAMDTGKNYAVKVVPKENLVKARARQKVRRVNVCRPILVFVVLSPVVVESSHANHFCSANYLFFFCRAAPSRNQDPSRTEAPVRVPVQALL
jgi:serine/threonine protein kinase